jgi:hypothetical protein
LLDQDQFGEAGECAANLNMPRLSELTVKMTVLP